MPQLVPRTSFTCQSCGCAFTLPPSAVKRGRGKFCSNLCHHYAPRTAFICQECGCSFDLRPSEVKRGRGKFCSSRCYHADPSRCGRPPTQPIEDRFWRYARKGADCWTWTGACSIGGYGQMGIKGKTVGAHRISYEIHIGPVPQGLYVLHRCDNPPCCNPRHLFLGTIADNNADRDAKGRVSRGDHVDPACRARGERCHKSPLTEEIVRTLRRDYALGGVSLKTLAQRYQVTKTTVRRAIQGDTWKHVSAEPSDGKPGDKAAEEKG